MSYLGIDGQDEMTLYVAAVGKVEPGRPVEWSGTIVRLETEENVTRIWLRSYSFWEGDAFVVEFPSGDFSQFGKGDQVLITGEITDLYSSYEDLPLLTGMSIEKKS